MNEVDNVDVLRLMHVQGRGRTRAPNAIKSGYSPLIVVTTGTSSSTQRVAPCATTCSEHVWDVIVCTSGGTSDMEVVKVVRVLVLAIVAYSVFVGAGVHAAMQTVIV